MDDYEIFEYKKNSILKLIRDAFHAASDAHEQLFKDSHSKENEVVSALYLNEAISLMSAAKAVYISNHETLEKYEIEELFNLFDVFKSEYLTNISTNHSHQWTDIEFNRYKEAAEPLISLIV